jgi:D-alanyl-D-alanine carboxypeptidase
MRRSGYLLWVGLLAGILFLGFLVRPQDAPRTAVAGEMSLPPPSPFPVRRPATLDPDVAARHVLLVDADSLYPLFARDAYQPVPVASTTKIMTALVARKLYSPEEVVTVSRRAAAEIGSRVGLLPGEKITVGSLILGLLIASGNDAAYALAEHGGSVDDFVARMNEEARRLGLRTTDFRDPAGLNDEGRSSAFDLAVLAARLLDDELLRSIVVRPDAEITSVDGRLVHHLRNSNRLVTAERYFPGILGIKTGYTPGAGHTLVAAARRDGRTLIAVILSTVADTKEASAIEAEKLLEWGFGHHDWVDP